MTSSHQATARHRNPTHFCLSVMWLTFKEEKVGPTPPIRLHGMGLW
jgi:hypothetical protein